MFIIVGYIQWLKLFGWAVRTLPNARNDEQWERSGNESKEFLEQWERRSHPTSKSNYKFAGDVDMSL